MRALILTLLLTSLQGQEPKPRFRLDAAKLNELTKKIVPVVERICERKFEHAPVIEIADGAAVSRSLTDDLRAQYVHLFAGQNKKKVERLAAMHANMIAAGMLGKYGFESKRLYLIPENVDVFLDIFGIDRRHGENLFQLVLGVLERVESSRPAGPVVGI